MMSVGLWGCRPLLQRTASLAGRVGWTPERSDTKDDMATVREGRSPAAVLGCCPPSPRVCEPRPCESVISASAAIAAQQLDACAFVSWVIDHGLDTHGQPTPELREIAKRWLHLGAHHEGGKTLVLQKQGENTYTAAHTHADARAWCDGKTPPPAHHELLQAIEARLFALGKRGILRALRLPAMAQKEQLVVGGTRLVKQGADGYTLQQSAAYGFDVGDGALDTVATFHAYLCYAADVRGPIQAAATEPLAKLAARIDGKLQDLRELAI